MKKPALIAGTVLFSMTSCAQPTDFSGTWVFEDQQSISGNLYSDVSPTQMKVTQKGDEIAIEKTTSAGNGDVTTNEIVTFDGKPFQTTTSSGRKKRITIKWSDDQKMLTEITALFSTLDNGKEDYRITDRWSLENGKL
ncbi:MAG: hypothetical protein Q8939_11940, partial [Bacteroidota bacterium]|nr:hypothetical protein [Bacteroidota bacterium]